MIVTTIYTTKECFSENSKNKTIEKIDFGSWVETNQGNYLIADRNRKVERLLLYL